MAHDSNQMQNIWIDNPYIKICPYTGYYQYRRKYESSTDGTLEQYYSWNLVKNRLRAVYPTGGRFGMCIVFEKTRTARFSPYGAYVWPDANMELPKWPLPTLISSGIVDFDSVVSGDPLNSALSASLVFTWTVNMSDTQSIRDTHPPAGFSSDLSGILVYNRNADIAIQTIKTYNIGSINIGSVFESSASPLSFTKNRYEIAPLEIQPPIDSEIVDSANAALSEITPSGIFWPSPDNSPTSSDNFDKNRILPFVESWREINIFPIGYDNNNYSTIYIGNFPIDYQYAYSKEFDGHSIMYKSAPNSEDDIIYEFDGFVYWVTREGPIEIINEEIGPDEEKIRTTERKVLNLIFGSGLTGFEDNEKSRYRSKPDQLVGSNSISPRDIKSETEGFLRSYGLDYEGYYNQIFEDMGMDSPGAPSESNEAWANSSEILNNYDVSKSFFSGNVMVDDDIFKRCMISGQVHSVMWSELGRVFRYSSPFGMPAGGSLTLIGAMTTVGILSSIATSSFTNDRFPIYLGGMSQSILHNNTMPEIGVMLGSHIGDHTIYLLESGAVVDPEYDTNIAPVNINKLLYTIPKKIYSYRGFAASPHRITILTNGILLIPTDIGILQYDYINNNVLCEWLNPVLMPFISDLLEVDNNINMSYQIGQPVWVEVETDEGPKRYPVTDINYSINKFGESYTPNIDDISSISASNVYERTSHIGSYGQVNYENSDFTGDLIVKLVR